MDDWGDEVDVEYGVGVDEVEDDGDGEEAEAAETGHGGLRAGLD